MRIIETDTNEDGHTVYLLEKGNATGTLITATVKAPGRIIFRCLLTGKHPTARDTVTAWRLVNEREQS